LLSAIELADLPADHGSHDQDQSSHAPGVLGESGKKGHRVPSQLDLREGGGPKGSGKREIPLKPFQYMCLSIAGAVAKSSNLPAHRFSIAAAERWF
jgi:hypothetical protein